MDSTECRRPTWIRAALLLITAGLASCTALAPRESPLPKDGPDLVEVYRNHLSAEGIESRSPRERLPLRAPEDLAGQRRTDLDPMQQRFQRLPNPDLVMHVFPHLARGRYPVPGYVTVFPMYERVEYAMPGEVAPGAAALDTPGTSTPHAAGPTARRDAAAGARN